MGGKVVYFIGNDGKVVFVLICVCGFDCGVQCQKIGLECDFVDYFDDFGDVL